MRCLRIYATPDGESHFDPPFGTSTDTRGRNHLNG